MARYLVKATSYIDGRIVQEGEEIEYSGKVTEFDEHLALVDDVANKKQAAADAKAVDEDIRAEAIKAKLLDDSNQPIDDKTPMVVVTRKLAEFKQANVFK